MAADGEKGRRRTDRVSATAGAGWQPLPYLLETDGLKYVPAAAVEEGAADGTALGMLSGAGIAALVVAAASVLLLRPDWLPFYGAPGHGFGPRASDSHHHETRHGDAARLRSQSVDRQDPAWRPGAQTGSLGAAVPEPRPAERAPQTTAGRTPLVPLPPSQRTKAPADVAEQAPGPVRVPLRPFALPAAPLDVDPPASVSSAEATAPSARRQEASATTHVAAPVREPAPPVPAAAAAETGNAADAAADSSNSMTASAGGPLRPETTTQPGSAAVVPSSTTPVGSGLDEPLPPLPIRSELGPSVPLEDREPEIQTPARAAATTVRRAVRPQPVRPQPVQPSSSSAAKRPGRAADRDLNDPANINELFFGAGR